ncbi:unnamed protein product [Polarella glacialis]|uniref:SAM domain-containing protein n=1 Tax=Polarella glacialis TaxID=89957 RepID=A0A813ISG0_POLGL|nr:unnamed protein product [Polarella glacialis]
MLQGLSDDDLKSELGVATLGHRRKILRAFQELQSCAQEGGRGKTGNNDDNNNNKNNNDISSASSTTRDRDQAVGIASASASPDFLLHFSLEDEAMLRRLAGDGQPLLLTWTTGEKKYSDFALNLGLSVRRNVGAELERRLVVIALDRQAQATMRSNNFQSVLFEITGDRRDAIWKFRYMVVHTMSHLGISSLVVDSDIVVMSDPFLAIHGDADLEISTDHFHPELDLWDQRFRDEDHLNVGVMFAKASEQVKQFMLEFLEEYNESMIAGIERDSFDQRSFCRFVKQRLFHMDSDPVHALYGVDQVFRNDAARHKTQQPLRIRALDPVVFAHGMNFFWLRAHTAPGRQKTLATVHANAITPKDYFLRDRGLWYLDDFAESFEEARFMTYEHPKGLSLGEDFQYLAEAVTVAVALERKLILPNTELCELPRSGALWSKCHAKPQRLHF